MVLSKPVRFRGLGGARRAVLSRNRGEISATEDVLRIDRSLDLGHPFEGGRRHYAGHEFAAQLADSMMMRQRAARFENLVARGFLDLEVDLRRVPHILVVISQVEIHANARVVELRDPAGDEYLTGQLALRVFFGNTALYVLAQRERVAPRHRGLKRLGDNVVVHDEVADVGDAES